MPIEIDMAHSILKSAKSIFFYIRDRGFSQIQRDARKRTQKRKKQVTTFGGCHLPSVKAHVQGRSVSFLFAAASWLSRARAFLSRSHVARLQSRRWLRRLGSRRTNPDFNEVCIAIAAVDDDDSAGINAAHSRQVIDRAAAKHVCLSGATGTTSVDNDVSRRVRRVLQL